MSRRRPLETGPRYFVAGFVAGLFLALGAQDACPEEAQLVKPLAIYTFAAGADLASTEWGLATNPHVREGNGLLQTRGRRIAAKGVLVLGLTATDVHLQKKGHKGWAKAIRVLAVGVQIAAATWNVKVSR